MKPNRRRSSKLTGKARALLQNHKVDDALTVASEACKLDSENVDAWFLLAAIHAKRQDYSAIARCCMQVIRHQPNNATAYFNLGLAQQSSGNLEAAVQAYREAIRQQPDYTAAQVNLAGVLVDVDQADEALERAETVLQNSPATIEMISIKGAALLHAGKPELAMEWLANARATRGDQPALMHTMACCHNVLGKTDEAIAVLVRLTETSSQYAPGWAELGRLALKQERFAEAAQYFGHAVRLQPTYENRFNLAHSLYASDNIEAARRLYHELLKEQPDALLVHNNLGRLYEKIGQIQIAKTHFRRAVELQPDSAIPHCNYGRTLLGVGKLDQALHEFDCAIGIDPGYFEGHYGRGRVMCEIGNNPEAVDSFRSAVQLKPDLIDAKYYIASLGGEGADEQDRQEFRG